MALTRAKYKRVPDLYVQGTEVVLRDGTVMWMQALNPFEVQEARHDAQVARSRLVMALQQHGSKEMEFVNAALWEDGIEGARKRVAESKSGEAVVKVVEELRSDPEWAERLDILERSESTSDTGHLESAEVELLNQIREEYVREVARRLELEADYWREQFAQADEDTLREEYQKLYIERRGVDLAQAEYRVTEIWYGARACDGTQVGEGQWDHSRCEGHQVQVFEDKMEVRRLPEGLSKVLGEACDRLAMTVRDAKDLARQGSSSASSPLPSAPEASTPSTPDATPEPRPGTSPSPSPTPSAS